MNIGLEQGIDESFIEWYGDLNDDYLGRKIAVAIAKNPLELQDERQAILNDCTQIAVDSFMEGSLMEVPCEAGPSMAIDGEPIEAPKFSESQMISSRRQPDQKFQNPNCINSVIDVTHDEKRDGKQSNSVLPIKHEMGPLLRSDSDRSEGRVHEISNDVNVVAEHNSESAVPQSNKFNLQESDSAQFRTNLETSMNVLERPRRNRISNFDKICFCGLKMFDTSILAKKKYKK
ncbi:hypothetical protein QAD02_000789 [Eretmocerus hayati]|nr:hypothetical protein QAD02_000789 [Eretmocerus hayati]